MNSAIRNIQLVAVVIVLVSTIIAFLLEIIKMYEAQTVTLADLLLMFIYIEVIGLFVSTPALLIIDINSVEFLICIRLSGSNRSVNGILIEFGICPLRISSRGSSSTPLKRPFERASTS